MTPPISIDGTDITGATIDGTDVTEITVDGDVVFSAQERPVAFSNLVAWYPFDSTFYGGANTDDVTGGDAGSGDSTSYDTTQFNSPSFVSSGGAKDINTGDASGFVEFDSQDGLDAETTALTSFPHNNQAFSYAAWVQFDSVNNNRYKYIMGGTGFNTSLFYYRSGLNTTLSIGFRVNDGSFRRESGVGGTLSNGEWYHFVGTYDGSSNRNVYIDGTQANIVFTPSKATSDPPKDFYIGNIGNTNQDAAAKVDDVRVYNKELTSSEVSDIYNNTKPSSKP
jgi:hypothetical protein